MDCGGHDRETKNSINLHMSTQTSQFAPELYFKLVAPAVDFYQKAFGAAVVRTFANDDGGLHVAELSIHGAVFYLHEELSWSKQRSPEGLGGTTVLLGIFVDDPDALMDKALAAGGQELHPMQDYFYGLRQGTVADPFGHHWMIQKRIPEFEGA
jgi:PhnB protein